MKETNCPKCKHKCFTNKIKFVDGKVEFTFDCEECNTEWNEIFELKSNKEVIIV